MNTSAYLAAGTALLLAGATATGAATVTGVGGTGTADMTVSMTVEDSCDLSITGNVDFGTEGPVTTGDTAETSGEITVACTTGTEFSLTLEDPGAGRQLSNGTDNVPYSLELTGATTITASGSDETFAVTGTLGTVGTQPPAGAYSDTVTVTLTIDDPQAA